MTHRLAMQNSYDTPLTSCPSCKKSSFEYLFTDLRGNRIHRCRHCSVQFMNPVYTDAHLQAFYSKYANNDPENIKKWHEPLLYGHDFYLQLIEKYTRPGNMFDVGCGGGHLLEAAQKRGWSISGYDVDAESTERVGQRLNCSVYSGDFLKLSIPSQSFDLITMHQVLEHLKKPGESLDQIFKLLNNQGLLFIAVPNIHSLSNRFKFFLESWGLRKKRRGVYYDSDHHLLYFSPNSLSSLLKQHGFEPIYLRNCHSVKPKQSHWQRWIAKHVTDHLFYKSAFLIIAKKSV